jgi:hypothetical protein
MKRTYLEEDMELIRKYFPGARTVRLRTPFDLTRRAVQLPRLNPESFHDTDDPQDGWGRSALWTN